MEIFKTMVVFGDYGTTPAHRKALVPRPRTFSRPGERMKNSVAVAKFAVLSCALFLSACATPGLTPVNPTNYRTKLSIERPDKSFYSAEYIGPASACFPPITNRICEPGPRGKSSYRETAKLEMEEFRIQLISSGTPTGKFMDDMVFLAAADLAMQRGYPFMTRLNTTESRNCGSIHSTTTYGSVNSNTGTYSGNTYLNQDVVCSNLRAGDFFFLKRREDLANGVFYRYNSGDFKTDILKPAGELYLYTTPNVMLRNYTIIKDGITRIGTSSAWKVTYDTAGLSNDLRAKYRITGNDPYTFKDERTENAEKAKDPVERNKQAP